MKKQMTQHMNTTLTLAQQRQEAAATGPPQVVEEAPYLAAFDWIL